MTDIIFDADGVLIDYTKGFFGWMDSQGHKPVCASDAVQDYAFTTAFPFLSPEQILACVARFSQSPEFEWLEPLEGAHEAVIHLRDLYPRSRLLCVTAPGDHPSTVAMRQSCLRPFLMDKVICLPLGSKKSDVYRDAAPASLVIDDLLKHIVEAQDLGHVGILMGRSYNQHEIAGRRADNWDDAVRHIVDVMDNSPAFVR
jgi:hypothetical protein